MDGSGREVRMDCPSLDACPEFPLPPSFSLRLYEPGDEEAWVAIHRVADVINTFSEETFRSQFGTDPAPLQARQVYLLAGSDPVGTATAWFEPNEPEMGRIHWVAIRPEYQGRGLAKPLIARVCRLLRECGHTKAYLTTSTARVPAVCLYFRFGFLPTVGSPAQRAVWDDFLNRTETESRATAIRACLEA